MVKADSYRRLGLEGALALLRKAGGPAAESATLIGQVQTKTTEDCVLHARYELFDHISIEGRPLLPGGQPFPDDFKQANGFPFGFVVGKSLTIEIPSTTSGRANATDILTILGPGQPIGLFELIGYLGSRTDLPLQPWTIMAGTKNIYPVCNVVSKAAANALNKFYDDRIDVDAYADADTPFPDSLRRFTSWQELHGGWAVEIVFLSRSLVEELGITQAPSTLSLAKARLAASLSGVAARRLSTPRSYFDGLWHIFKGGNVSNDRTNAFKFWSRILASAYGHRMSYRLADDADDLFPVKATVRFLGDALACPTYPFLIPTMAPQDMCFLPADEIISFRKPQEIVEVCKDVFNTYHDRRVDSEKLAMSPERFFNSLQLCLTKDRRTNHEYSSYDGYWEVKEKGLPNTKKNPVRTSRKAFFGEKWFSDDVQQKTDHLPFRAPMNALVKINTKVLLGQ